MPDPAAAPVPSPRARRRRYDAFLSYSRDAEGDYAYQIRDMLRGFGRGAAGAHDDRDLNLFVDRASLVAHHHVWQEIENHLSRSNRFILFASPGAATSEWVDQELRWWLDRHPLRTVYIALTGGEIVFDHDAGRIDPTATTALPPILVELLDAEPRWVDLRGPRAAAHDTDHPGLPHALAELAAPLRGATKEQVLSAHIAAQRGRNRRARAVASGMSVLLALSVVNGVIAGSSAEQEAAASFERDAHLLAAASHARRAEDPDLARYLAAEAYHRAPSTQTRHAFLTAALDTPHNDQHLQRTVRTPGVTALAPTRTGVVGRTANGGLLRWNPGDGDPEILTGAAHDVPSPGLPPGATTVAGSADGRVVAAVDRAGVVIGRFDADEGPLAGDGELARIYRPVQDDAQVTGPRIDDGDDEGDADTAGGAHADAEADTDTDTDRLPATAVALTPAGDTLLISYRTFGTCPDGNEHQLVRVDLTGPAGDLELAAVAAQVHEFFRGPRAHCTQAPTRLLPVGAVTTGFDATALRADPHRVVLAHPHSRHVQERRISDLAPVDDGTPERARPGYVPAPSLTTWARATGTGNATEIMLHRPLTPADADHSMSCPVPRTWSGAEIVTWSENGRRALLRTDDGLVACAAARGTRLRQSRTWHLPGVPSGAEAVLAPGNRVIAADGERLFLWHTTPESSDMELPPGVAGSPSETPVVAARPAGHAPGTAADTAVAWSDGTVQVHEKGELDVPGAPRAEGLLPTWLAPSAGGYGPGDTPGDLLLLAGDGRAWLAATDRGPDDDAPGTPHRTAVPLPGFRDLLLDAAGAPGDRDPGCLPRREADAAACPRLVGARWTPDRLVLIDSAGGAYLLDPELDEPGVYVPAEDEARRGTPIPSPWEEPGRVAVDSDGRWAAVVSRGRALFTLDLTAAAAAPGDDSPWALLGTRMSQVQIVDDDAGPGHVPELVALTDDGTVRAGRVAGDRPLEELLPPGEHGEVLAVLAEPGLVVRNEGTQLALYDITTGERLGAIATSLRATRGTPAAGTVQASLGRLLMVQDHGLTISRALDKDVDTMLAEACTTAAPALTPVTLGDLGLRHTPTRCRIAHTPGLLTFDPPVLLVPPAQLTPTPLFTGRPG